MEKLKELREAKNMTQSQLGEYIGAKKSAISLWESGKRQPDQETLMRLASYFSVTVDYLLGHESPDQIKKAPTPDDARAEAKMLLENMTDDEYERALAMLKLLNGRK
jgi:transcriptional regulator with XRE-family HTH domain